MKTQTHKIIAISGVKNSGKTTLIASILPILKRQGLKVAVIKHDGHSFVPEISGTDTSHYLESGAIGAAVFDGEKFKAVKFGKFTELDLTELFPEADLYLLEGFKYSNYKKIELVREGNSEATVCDPETLLAVVTALPIDIGIPVLSPDNPEEVAKFILNHLDRNN